MAWVKLDDKVMNHPKIHDLSDKSFRLWIWGLCYCQQHLTDGLIPSGVIPGRISRAAADLVTRELWLTHPKGFAVRDFLQWNDSKAEVEQKRKDAAVRMSSSRAAKFARTSDVTSSEVLVRCGVTSDLKEEKIQELGLRAGQLLGELYPSWYAKYRHGAKLRLVANSLAYQDALSLVGLWDDARLEKLAQIVLTTDDEWIAGTDRSFRIFASKASWADDRLRQVEAQRARTA